MPNTEDHSEHNDENHLTSNIAPSNRKTTSEWADVAEELNRIRKQLREKDFDSSEGNSHGGSESASIDSDFDIEIEQLEKIGEEEINSIEIYLIGRSFCSQLHQQLGNFLSTDFLSLQVSDQPEDASETYFDREAWYEELNSILTSSTAKRAESIPCIKSIQKAIRLVIFFKDQNEFGTHSNGEVGVLSKEFQQCWKVRDRIYGLITICNNGGDVDVSNLKELEGVLIESSLGLKERGCLWLEGAQRSFWLGKPDNVRKFLSLEMSEAQRQQAREKFVTLFKMSSLPFAPQSELTEQRIDEVLSVSGSQTLDSTKETWTRSNSLIAREFGLIGIAVQECADSIDLQLAKRLDTIASKNIETAKNEP